MEKKESIPYDDYAICGWFNPNYHAALSEYDNRENDNMNLVLLNIPE